MNDLQTITPRRLRKFFAAHHYCLKSQNIDEIAEVVNVKPRTIVKWFNQDKWQSYLDFWGGIRNPPTVGDLAEFEKIWEERILADEDFLLPEDVFDDTPVEPSYDYDPLFSIKSQLFCVENLSEPEIRQRLAEERENESDPVRFDGQHFLGCRWWLYPNFDAGIYSKVFARANAVENLVVGEGDETHLVGIENERLSLSQSVSDDAVVVPDNRLLVCL